MTNWHPDPHTKIHAILEFGMPCGNMKTDYQKDQENIFQGIQVMFPEALAAPRSPLFNGVAIHLVCCDMQEALVFVNETNVYMNGLVEGGILNPNGWIFKLYPTHDKDKA